MIFGHLKPYNSPVYQLVNTINTNTKLKYNLPEGKTSYSGDCEFMVVLYAENLTVVGQGEHSLVEVNMQR